MFLHELLLFVLTLIMVVLCPLYIFFRKKMVTSQKRPIHSRKRVLKLILINLGLNSIAYSIFLSILITLLLEAPTINIFDIVISLLFLFVTGLIFYGQGMYISSITLKDFTLPELKSHSSFKTQLIATRLFHGPISHFLIFSGYIVALLLLGILDMSIAQGASGIIPYVLICGAIVGAIYTWGHIFNGALPYQFLTGLFSLAILLTFSKFTKQSLFDFSVASYFFACVITFLISGAVYYILVGRKKENIWDLSGN